MAATLALLCSLRGHALVCGRALRQRGGGFNAIPVPGPCAQLAFSELFEASSLSAPRDGWAGGPDATTYSPAQDKLSAPCADLPCPLRPHSANLEMNIPRSGVTPGMVGG
eukprot:4571907-Pleurochrysis_carterae.AAC.2